MWLSKMLSRNYSIQKAEKGNVTISENQNFETISSVNSRNTNSYSPYGYASVPPVGEEVILIPSSDGQIALGTKCQESCVESGEVKISSLGGASIILKNDGSVVINSMIIDKDGVIRN